MTNNQWLPPARTCILWWFLMDATRWAWVFGHGSPIQDPAGTRHVSRKSSTGSEKQASSSVYTGKKYFVWSETRPHPKAPLDVDLDTVQTHGLPRKPKVCARQTLQQKLYHNVP